MGWAIGWDERWQRDIGYGVLTTCDHPDCTEEIDRGLAHVCANQEPRGGEGCGLYFCGKHLGYMHKTNDELTCCCERCRDGLPPFAKKPENPLWLDWKHTDASWREWREQEGMPEPTPEEVKRVAILCGEWDGVGEYPPVEEIRVYEESL